MDIASNILPAIYPFLPDLNSSFGIGCLAHLRLYKTRGKRQLSQQIAEHKGSRTRLGTHWLLAAFFLPGPLWPRNLKYHQGVNHLLRSKHQAGWRWGAGRVPAGVPAGLAWGLPLRCRLQDLRQLQRGWHTAKDASQLWPPVSQPGSPESVGSSQGFPASLPPNWRRCGGCGCHQFPWVWAAGFVTRRLKPLVILAPSQSPMVAET